MSGRTKVALLFAVSLCWLGCGGGTKTSPDAGPQVDAGAGEDAGTPTDGGVDGGAIDGGEMDGGMVAPGDTLAVGWSHACQLRIDGGAFCWGDNAEGQLGIGEKAPVAVGGPTEVEGAHAFVHLSANAATTCAIDSSGALYCWGRGTTSPARIGTANDWSTVGAGDAFSCALKQDGALYCFDTSTAIPTAEPSRLGVDPFLSLSVGFDHACAIRTDHLMFCWGSNQSAQLGIENGGMSLPLPVHVGEDLDWATVSAGRGHTLATKQDGSLWCWGDNLNGVCTTSLPTLVSTPRQVGFEPDWARVAAGRSHTCALKRDGALYCWGDDAFGELGTGTISQTPVGFPERVGADTWKAIGAGDQMTCGLHDDDSLHCWGSNAAGALGLGTVSEKRVPTQTNGAVTALRVQANNGTTCASSKDGSTTCWGFNRNGEAGAGSTANLQSPQKVSGAWRSLALGTDHTVAVSYDGTLWGWGLPANGDLLSVSSTASAPVSLDPGKQWQLAVAGVGFSCATKSPGALFCFGLNAFGSLGDGTTTDRTTPTQAGTFTDWIQLSAGLSSVCGVRANGELHCWGDDLEGQLGLGTFGGIVTSPTRVGSDSDWAQVSMGMGHACGLRSNDALYCWGQNLSGQLGLGTTSDREPTPMLVGADTDWATVAAGRAGTCAIKQNGTLWCWGGTEHFHETLLLPDGSLPLSPAQVGSDADWTQVAMDDTHSCATKSSGDVFCWGANQFGQLGQNDSWRAVPTKVE